MAYANPYLEEFRTEEKGNVNCRLVNARTVDGKEVTFQQEGYVYRVGAGTAVRKLLELLERRRRSKRLWSRLLLLEADYAALDTAIERLTKILDESIYTWTE